MIKRIFRWGGLTVMGSLFYWPLVWGEVLFFGDNYSLFAPTRFYFAQELLAGNLALVNQYIFGGAPFLADIGFGLLSPLNLPFYFLGPLRALTVSALLSLVVFGGGMYWWLRARGESDRVAVLGTIIGLCSGSVVAALNNLSILQTVAFFPLLVGFVEKAIRLDRRFFIPAGVTLGIASLGGHPQFIFGLLMTLPIYLLVEFWQRRQRVVVGLVAMSVIGVGVAAVQLLPFYQFSRHHARPVSRAEYAVSGSLPMAALPRLIVPGLFGEKRAGTSWALLSERNMGLASGMGYAGTIGLLLAAIGVFYSNDRLEKLLILPAGAGLVMALGEATPLFQLCTKLVPFCDQFRNPEQYLFFWTFWLVPPAVVGVKNALEERRQAASLGAIGGGLLMVGVVAVTVFSARFDTAVARLLIERNHETFGIIRAMTINNLLISGALMLAASLVILKARTHRVALLAGIVFFELFLVSRGDLITAPLDKVEYPAPRFSVNRDIRYLSSADVTPYQDLLTYWNQYAVREPFGASRVDEHELTTFDTLGEIASSQPVDINLVHRIPSPDGYGSLVYEPYADWLGEETAINSVDTSVLLGDSETARGRRMALDLKFIIEPGGKLSEPDNFGVESYSSSGVDSDTPEVEYRDLPRVDGWPVSVYLGGMVSLISIIGSASLWFLKPRFLS